MILFNYCTLDDYLQIQALLKYEQRRRENAFQQHMQHKEALQKRREQQYRLARAMQNLKILKENYRRERAYRMQRYMNHYRNQAMIAAVEDVFYRQCLASAIEQRRADTIRQQYLQSEEQRQELKRQIKLQQQQQQQQLQEEEEKDDDDNDNDDSSEDKGFEEFHANQLSELLRLLFSGQLEHQVKQQESQHQPTPPQQEEPQQLNDAQDEEEASDLWNYITHLQDEQQEQDKPEQNLMGQKENLEEKELKEKEHEEKEHEEKKHEKLEEKHHEEGEKKMEKNSEESTFNPNQQEQGPVTTGLQSNNQNNDDYYDNLINDDVSKVFQRQAAAHQQQEVREPEVVNVIDKSNRAGVPEQPYMENWDNPQKVGVNQNDVKQEEVDPPLQNRVLNLKDLLNELVSDESSDPTTTMTNQEHSFPHMSNNEKEIINSANNNEDNEDNDDDDDDDENDAMNLFEPKQVVTEAEPTPQPTTTADDDDEPASIPITHHHHHNQQHHHEQPSENLVHKIAEQQKRNVPPADPAKYEELQKVDHLLEEIKATRLATVLKTPLHFENQSGTLQVTARTPSNRQFLGCEDEIMRLMLKLDTIESNGDEGIRGERRALVKKAEGMLEQLDEHKQIEWEMARMTRKQQHHKKKKKNRQKNRQHHHNNKVHHPSHRQKAGGIIAG